MPTTPSIAESRWEHSPLPVRAGPGRVFIEHADAAKAKVHIPTGAGDKQVHIILEMRDRNPIASLRDYRRAVISVENRIIELDASQK